MNYISKTINSIKNLGFANTFIKVRSRLSASAINEKRLYERWITEAEMGNNGCDVEAFEYRPKISVLVPVYNIEGRYLTACIDSVKNQSYSNWELCLADDCSTWSNVKLTLEKYKSEDSERIKVIYRSENGHISECSNSALEIATGEFAALLDCDDLLTPNALLEVVRELNQNRKLDLIYSDEDKIEDGGTNRHRPHFKADWSPDTLMSHMYICHLSVYRTSVLRNIGGFRKGFEGAQDYDLALRVTEKTNAVAHIPKILYHWRERKESTAQNPGAKPYFVEAAYKAKKEALDRRGISADLEYIEAFYLYRVKYRLSPDVRIHEVKASEYEKANEIHDGVILICRDDVTLKDGSQKTFLAAHALLKHTGAASAKTLKYNSHRIQQVGRIITSNGVKSVLNGCDDRLNLSFFRNSMECNYSIISGDYFAISAQKLQEIGGICAEKPYEIAVIDLCYRLIQHGYYNVVCPDVICYADEKERDISRDELQRYEINLPMSDSFYNINLSEKRADFSCAFEK